MPAKWMDDIIGWIEWRKTKKKYKCNKTVVGSRNDDFLFYFWWLVLYIWDLLVVFFFGCGGSKWGVHWMNRNIKRAKIQKRKKNIQTKRNERIVLSSKDAEDITKSIYKKKEHASNKTWTNTTHLHIKIKMNSIQFNQCGR